MRPWQLDEDWLIRGEGRFSVEHLAKEVAALGVPDRPKGSGMVS